jgi:small subunit ribosomal protein S16
LALVLANLKYFGVSTVPHSPAYPNGCAFLICLPCGVSWSGGCFKFQGTNMVVIRLARSGSKRRPFYYMVVTDSRTRRDGKFIERVGFYNPVARGGEEPLRVSFDRIDYWSQTGAQLSSTVTRLVAQAKASTSVAAAAA